MRISTTADVYEAFRRHPGWGWGRAADERHGLWLDLCCRAEPEDPDVLRREHPLVVRWLEQRCLLRLTGRGDWARVACVVTAARLFGAHDPEADWYCRDDETGEVVCAMRCPTCRGRAWS